MSHFHHIHKSESLTFNEPVFFLVTSGQPGLLHTGTHQGEPADLVAVVLRPGPEEDIWPHGEGLLPPLLALRTLPGPCEPKEVHVNVLFIVVD